ncbi:MAG: YkgJ family cysteine cluster protein [Gammaproteobacteria bacterium]
MTNAAATTPDTGVNCVNCEACCCRLEVMLITDTGVPVNLIEIDEWGGRSMARLEDGWCAALDRDTMMCTIYGKRPWICREFAMGGYECIAERAASLQVAPQGDGTRPG